MAKKRSPGKVPIPPELLRKLTSPLGKYDTIWRRLSDDGTMVEIYRVELDEETKRRALEVGLRQLRAAVKGGKQLKVRIGIAGAILWCIEKYPSGSTRAWWNRLMRFSEVQPLQLNVDGVRYDVYGTDADKDDGKLVEVLVAKDWKTDDRPKLLRFRAFQMYASQIKKKVRK